MENLNRVKTIEDLLVSMNAPPYRSKQIFEAVYQQYAKNYTDITSLPKDLRTKLVSELGNKVLSLSNVCELQDEQADKVLFETKDKNRVEAVLMTFKPNEQRLQDHLSLCISSQSGCNLGCTFCATGAIGFKKNLTVDEITDQILYFMQRDQKVGNVSFMGMGEPLVNPNFFDALRVITDEDKMGFSQRRLSVSTVGIIPGIQRLQKDFPQVSLAFSLHTPFPEQRLEIMPITKVYPIDKVMEALNQFIDITNKKVFIAYVLLDGVNDSYKHARKLAKLIKEQGKNSYLYHVNLIRFNPGSTFKPYDKPSTARVNAFRKELDMFGIKHTLRQSFGVGIDAVCGQLYGKYNKITKN